MGKKGKLALGTSVSAAGLCLNSHVEPVFGLRIHETPALQISIPQ
jgi:hypothetical protein